MSTNPLTPDAWATTLEAARANTLASSTAMAEHLNEELKNRFLLAFEGWQVSVLAGKFDNTNPPHIPYGYRLVTTADGFTYPEPGNILVCEMPEIPPDYSKPQVIVLPRSEEHTSE